ncbi:MAG: class I SAM-dependent methyltransferase, partial [Caldisericia bacterium]|nr:class I SAM-dependent methyltransferase [Caldisericia bacterium]
MENWFFDFFDDNYLKIYLEKQDPLLTKKQVDLIINELSLNAFDKTLDLGCGIGRHLIEIGKRGFFGVGIDFNERYIDLANRL